jgi:colanic acid/amylovoran biosynthesis protein
VEAPLRICLMGASTDTGNLGVSALCLSILGGLAKRAPDAEVTVFDNRRGHGSEEERFDGRVFRFRRNGLHDSRRLYRGDSLWNVAIASRLGGVGNPAAEAIREADAVLDVTGGDSFTDLYGGRRFWSGCAAKRLALRYSGGLVLVPQTYGPFASDDTRAEAAGIVGAAKAAWARDARSFDVLRGLLASRFDPSRHRVGVDVAFALGAADPRDTLPPALAHWLSESRDGPTVGVNVSGLTYLHDERARKAYGLVSDYRATIHGLLERLVERTRARIVLLPHVLVPTGHFESDRDACEAARSWLGSRAKGRVLVAPDLSASEAKGLIARLDWFCGTRMHSTIAALSSGVPAAALAYSAKTAGVFETCAQGDHVADLRALATKDAVETAWRSWERREDARRRLADALPAVLATAQRQMDEIVATCRDAAARRRGPFRVAM